ncbi:hypothetical protein [Photobacterium kasasachensis]|uniref:hypothetical protein n=1 Tax=Photobacterium kasasachensis TaxID=2910240 RepID=UPI003D14D717
MISKNHLLKQLAVVLLCVITIGCQTTSQPTLKPAFKEPVLKLTPEEPSVSYTAQSKDAKGYIKVGTASYKHNEQYTDTFKGEWQTYYDPFSKNMLSFPYKGQYESSLTGAVYRGVFFAVPTRGTLKAYFESDLDYIPAFNQANVVFIGEVSFKGQSETLVLSREDYHHGKPLVEGGWGNSLYKADADRLVQLKQRLKTELNEQDIARDKMQKAIVKAKENARARAKSASSESDYSGFFAFAGAIAAVAYGADAGLTSDSAAALGVGTYNLLSEGDASKLNDATKSLKYDTSERDLKLQLDKDIAEIKAKYAKQNSVAQQEYQNGVARSEANKLRLEKGQTTQQRASDRSTSTAVERTVSVSSSASTQLATTGTKAVAVPSSANAINSLSKDAQKKSSYFLRVEAVAYCNMKKGGWKCDGPSGWSIGSRVKSLSNALDRSGCRNPSSRQNAFRANEHLDETYLEGRIVYCGFPLNSYNATLAQKYSLPNKGSDAYDKDIAKKYSLPNRLLVTRNIYKTQTPMTATSELYQAANGLVPNIVERTE